MKNNYNYWIDRWQKSKSFRVENDRIKQKSYLFSSFPKTNMYGFQNGNIRPQLIGDFFSRYQRMDNFNVMYPIGYDSLGLKSFLENKKFSNLINDDISLIFKEQFLKLGIGIDDTKEIDLKHNEYLTILQLAFIDLYEKGYIKYDNVIVYQDDNQKKIIDSYYKNDNLHPNRVKAFYLDISECMDLIISKINELNTTEEVKNQLLDMLEPNQSVNIEFMLTNNKKIEVNMKNPEYIGGISFIILHPDFIDVEDFIDLDELSALEKYLSDDNTNDFGMFTGNYAINPLTGNKIPVFLSVNYDDGLVIVNGEGVEVDDSNRKEVSSRTAGSTASDCVCDPVRSSSKNCTTSGISARKSSSPAFAESKISEGEHEAITVENIADIMQRTMIRLFKTYSFLSAVVPIWGCFFYYIIPHNRFQFQFAVPAAFFAYAEKIAADSMS